MGTKDMSLSCNTHYWPRGKLNLTEPKMWISVMICIYHYGQCKSAVCIHVDLFCHAIGASLSKFLSISCTPLTSNSQEVMSFSLPSGSLWSRPGTGLLQQQTCLEGGGPRPFLLAVNRVSGTKGSTQLFLKLKVFMLEMKLNCIWAGDVLVCAKPRTTQWLLVVNRGKPE